MSRASKIVYGVQLPAGYKYYLPCRRAVTPSMFSWKRVLGDLLLNLLTFWEKCNTSRFSLARPTQTLHPFALLAPIAPPTPLLDVWTLRNRVTVRFWVKSSGRNSEVARPAGLPRIGHAGSNQIRYRSLARTFRGTLAQQGSHSYIRSTVLVCLCCS